jgi:hypothetical protein
MRRKTRALPHFPRRYRQLFADGLGLRQQRRRIRPERFCTSRKKRVCSPSVRCLSVLGRMEETITKKKVWSWNMTTTNRRDTKTSTTFSVFLLTGFPQKLILRFADFKGNVAAPEPVFLFRGNDRLRNHVAAEHQTKKNATTCGAKDAPSSSCREASKIGGSGWLFAFATKRALRRDSESVWRAGKTQP